MALHVLWSPADHDDVRLRSSAASDRMEDSRMSLPAHLIRYYGSTRDYKAEKRTQLRRILHDLDKLSFGCAYLPDREQRTVTHVKTELRRLSKRLSVKEWGR